MHAFASSLPLLPTTLLLLLMCSYRGCFFDVSVAAVASRQLCFQLFLH
jgi:hypothetical protein